jgi:hypothetical protein
LREGNSCFNVNDFFTPLGSCAGGFTDPVLVYSHGSDGCSVTGGYVYRGPKYPALNGSYFFSDYCSGIVWKTQKPLSGPWSRSTFLTSGQNVTAFGEDQAGEVYLVGQGGTIFRLADPVCAPRPNVQVTAVPGAPNNLQVTVTGLTNPNTPDNLLFTINFTQLDNAVVNIANADHATPFVSDLGGTSPVVSFTVKRPQPPVAGLATTVRFTVTDACGDWPTFVGGGFGSF